MTIGVIVAMESEKNLVLNILDNATQTTIDKGNFVEGTIGKHHIVLLKSSIGKVSAAVGTLLLIQNFKPDCIINTGVAGSLNKKIGVMDIVVGERTVYHDVDCSEGNEIGQIQGLPRFFFADKNLVESAKKLNISQKIHFGLICSGDRFISKLDELQNIQNIFPDGLAVDMESNAIAQVCYLYNVPFMSMRIISDTPGITDHVSQYFDFWKEAPKTSLEVIKQLFENL